MDRNNHSPLGKLVNVGNHQLPIYCAGEGSLKVVFALGRGGWSLDWHLVQTEVAKFSTACSYDRAGFVWSNPGPKPRTSQQIVTELHALLTRSGVKQPYILVGASFGGHTVRLFAENYPGEVAGIILLDARHEAIQTKMPPAWRKLESAGKGMYQFMLLASKVGTLKRLGNVMGERALPPIVLKLPPEMRPLYLEVGFQPKYFQANLDGLAAVADSDKQLSATGSLGSIPLTVIRHGIPDLFTRMPVEQAKQAEQVWQEFQSDLAKLSANGRVLLAEKSGHAIQIEQPDLVVAAIREMVETVRKAFASA